MSAQGQGVTSAEALPTPKVWDVHLHPHLAVGGPGRGVRTTPIMFLNTPPWKTGARGSGTHTRPQTPAPTALPLVATPQHLLNFVSQTQGAPSPQLCRLPFPLLPQPPAPHAAVGPGWTVTSHRGLPGPRLRELLQRFSPALHLPIRVMSSAESWNASAGIK